MADYAFRGPQNRVITVDERSGQARWVVDGASNYIPVPGTQDLVVYLVRETGFDMAQVSIPPP